MFVTTAPGAGRQTGAALGNLTKRTIPWTGLRIQSLLVNVNAGRFARQVYNAPAA